MAVEVRYLDHSQDPVQVFASVPDRTHPQDDSKMGILVDVLGRQVAIFASSTGKERIRAYASWTRNMEDEKGWSYTIPDPNNTKSAGRQGIVEFFPDGVRLVEDGETIAFTTYDSLATPPELDCALRKSTYLTFKPSMVRNNDIQKISAVTELLAMVTQPQTT
jgi:hypothetical protein